MRTLMTLERTYRAEFAAGPGRVLQAVVPTGKRGAIATPLGDASGA